MNPKQKATKRHGCSVCDKAFPVPSQLEIHFRKHTGEPPFQCQVCKKGFKSLGELTIHSVAHSEKRMFSCIFCEKSFKNVGTLCSHICAHTKEKPYFCSKCPGSGSSFTRKLSLDQHQVLRHGLKSGLKCEKCPKVFYAAAQLKVHMRVHTVKNRFPVLCVRRNVQPKRTSKPTFL